jgi:glycosyltransferase involved in cell wall biosynthesis
LGENLIGPWERGNHLLFSSAGQAQFFDSQASDAHDRGLPVRIAVDFQSTQGHKTGIGSAAAGLVAAMRAQNSGIEFLCYTRPSPKDLSVPGRILWESFEIPLRALRDKVDAIYSPGFAPAILSPKPQIVTVHDVIGLAYPSNQKGASRFYWSRWLPAALGRARRLVASSESTRRDIERFLKIPENKISVVPLHVSSFFRKLNDKGRITAVLEKYGLGSGPFFISVGTLEPRKNLINLLRACESLRGQNRLDFDLVIAGKPGTAQKELVSFIKERGLQSRVKILGYASDEELAGLYNAAMGLVCLSLYEGFGLTVLEGMSCGISGVVSKRSSLPEVAGDAAILVDPENTDEIAEALNTYASDATLRRRLGEAALQRSREFSAEKTAQSMIEIFKQELGKP